MGLPLQPSPSRTPFLMPDGTVNPHWLDFLNALTNSVNTGQVPSDLTVGGSLINYHGVAGAGWGLAQVVGFGRITAQVAGVGNVVTHTVAGSDGSFLVSANVNVTTSTLHNFNVSCDYTDETNTGRTLVLALKQVAGALFVVNVTNVTGAGPYYGVPEQIRCLVGTTIKISTGGAFGAVVYNVEGVLMRVA